MMALAVLSLIIGAAVDVNKCLCLTNERLWTHVNFVVVYKSVERTLDVKYSNCENISVNFFFVSIRIDKKVRRFKSFT